jgi:V8-like Glu-specific endopeptidase
LFYLDPVLADFWESLTMTKLTNAFFASALLSTTVWALPALAQQAGGSNPGTGEAMRDVGADFKPGRAKPIAPPKLTEDEASRAAPLVDEDAAVKSYGVVGKSADGKDIKTAPSEVLRDLVIEQLNAPADGGQSDGDSTSGPNKAEDPALKEGDEANRQVFGNDDRVQINCLYSHEDKDWLTDFLFVPGLNGNTADDAPFGGFEYQDAYIIQGFIDNYQGYYGSVVPWDLGIITLKQDVGNSLGWLGYSNFDDLGDFTANIVGYPGDKPMGTMWRATCDVLSENIGPDNFLYDCDTYPGSSGSSVYAYDNGSKQRVITGVNVAESPDANTAVRLSAVNVEWINSLWK